MYIFVQVCLDVINNNILHRTVESNVVFNKIIHDA